MGHARGIAKTQNISPRFRAIDRRERPHGGLLGRICISIAYAPIALAPGGGIVIRDQRAFDATDGAGDARTVDAGPYRIPARVQGASAEPVSDPVTVTVIP